MANCNRRLVDVCLPHPPSHVPAAPLPPGWPAEGQIEYEGVTAIYRPGLPPVLRNLTFTVQAGLLRCCWDASAACWPHCKLMCGVVFQH